MKKSLKVLLGGLLVVAIAASAYFLNGGGLFQGKIRITTKPPSATTEKPVLSISLTPKQSNSTVVAGTTDVEFLKLNFSATEDVTISDLTFQTSNSRAVRNAKLFDGANVVGGPVATPGEDPNIHFQDDFTIR